MPAPLARNISYAQVVFTCFFFFAQTFNKATSLIWCTLYYLQTARYMFNLCTSRIFFSLFYKIEFLSIFTHSKIRIELLLCARQCSLCFGNKLGAKLTKTHLHPLNILERVCGDEWDIITCTCVHYMALSGMERIKAGELSGVGGDFHRWEEGTVPPWAGHLSIAGSYMHKSLDMDTLHAEMVHTWETNILRQHEAKGHLTMKRHRLYCGELPL